MFNKKTKQSIDNRDRIKDHVSVTKKKMSDNISFISRTDMEIWRKGKEVWPPEVVLYIGHMPFTQEEVHSFQEVVDLIEVWLKEKHKWDDSDGDSSGDEEESCMCERAAENLLLPCGANLE